MYIKPTLAERHFIRSLLFLNTLQQKAVVLLKFNDKRK